MTKEDREYAGTLKRFIKTQAALLASKELDDKHVEQEIAAKLAEVKARRAYLKAARAECRAEHKILAREKRILAKMLADDAK